MIKALFGCYGNQNEVNALVENCIFLFLTCWRVSLFKCAIRTHFAIKPPVFWTFWHQHQKNRPMDDKVRTKVAKICIKTKWRPTESRIFKLNQFLTKHVSNCSLWYPPQISQQSWTSKMKHFGDIGSQWYKMADFLIEDNIVKYAN